MPDEIRVSRPSMSQRPEQPSTQPMSGGDMNEPQSSSKMPWVILGIVIIVLVVLGVLFRDKLFKSGGQDKMAKSTGYQAVFLTNGQVYFGNISDIKNDYVTLKDIYYLQVVQPPLQGNQQGAAGQQPAQAQPQISLVKLGNELHGPVDEMHISKMQILFYEDLKNDGQVVKAIESYKANPTGAPAK